MSRANPRFRRVNPNLPLVGTTNGVVMYVIQGVIENQMTINTLMYSSAVPNPTNTQLATLLTNISANIISSFKALISADWNITQELLKVVHRNDIATVTLLTHANNIGTRPAGHEPTEVAGVTLKYSGVKGQHGRGRMSTPGVYTGDVTNSQWTGATITTNQGVFNAAALLTASDGSNTWTPCIGQRGSTPPRLIVGFTPIVKFSQPILLGTIRRRKIGRGK
jgi:hypothetical protein